MQRTGAVIVAAGMSSRMGEFKPMMKMGSITIVKRIIANFQQAGVSPIVVVTGYRAAELEKHIAKQGVIYIRNNSYETTQMSDSAKMGFSFLLDKCDRVFFTPVDVPLFRVGTVRRLMQTNVDFIKPVCDNEDGHPILFSNKILPKIIACKRNDGLKAMIYECCPKIDVLQVDDEGVLRDADTMGDYERLVKMHSEQLLRPIIDISIMREKKILDKTSTVLLQAIEYTGTVKDACDKIGISYSKAWIMIKEMEQAFGFSLLERRQGGEYGGTSSLTKEGKELLNKYEMYIEEVTAFSEQSFTKHFGKGE